MKGNIFSPEDKEFMEIVQSDLQKYLHKNIFPSRTVLVFPPFNGFRRFLIHKLIEDHFAASEVAAFSIGQDINRRIVVCYKGLISEAVRNGLPATIPQTFKPGMIDKEKPNRQRQTPTAAVYRPPAARLAENRKNTDTDDQKSADTKKSRVRRPDQQMYVPRPKRASYGNELPRSRSRSNSRLSLDCDPRLEMKKTPPDNSKEIKTPKENVASKDSSVERILKYPTALDDNVEISSSHIGLSTTIQPSNEINLIMKSSCDDSEHDSQAVMDRSSKEDKNSKCAFEEENVENERANSSKTIVPMLMKEDGRVDNENTNCSIPTGKENFSLGTVKTPESERNTSKTEGECLINPESVEAIETISISSESKSEDSSSSSMNSTSESKTSDSSVDYKDDDKHRKHKNIDEMDIDEIEVKGLLNKHKGKSHHKEEKTNRKAKQSTKNSISEVLVISDTSSSDDSMKSAEDRNENNGIEKSKSQPPSKKPDVQIKSLTKQSSIINPDECDWESLYDDSGECLVPSLMEELTNSVGRVKVTSADSDYRPYQSIEERTNDGECVIEIYDFPAEFKTTDLFNVFAAYRNKNFQIKWVDDTHALGIFPSPLMADEVLGCTLPFVKTRPLRLGIAESRNKARNLVLPPLPSMERPKTCTALARRLVTGALGLRIPTSSQEREKEKQVLKEAREKRRLEAKQREAAWEGTITSGSAI